MARSPLTITEVSASGLPLLEALLAVPLPPRVAVAYSGGRDSTALLHASFSAAALRGVQVTALHVHHGLSPNADAWAAHCRRQCEDWSTARCPLGFEIRRLAPDDRRSGESVEAWARRGRYRALADMAHAVGAPWVLLAHHRVDQAETFLLQALRGGGPAGLSAMPASRCADGVVWKRPWLQRTRGEIDAYLVGHDLAWVEDESNADPRHLRNRLRSQVWPVLANAFPQAEAMLTAAARCSAEAATLLADIAAADLAEAAPTGPLQIVRWLSGSPARRSNLLRAWLRREGRAASPALLARLMAELPARPAGRWSARGGELRLHDGWLAATRASAVVEARRETRLCLTRPGHHPLPGWQGSLVVGQAPRGEAGIALSALARVELRERSGGERWQAGAGRPPRCLKKQFQAARVPSWARGGPLVYRDGRLLFVAGLGINAVGLTTDEQLRPMRLDWLPAGGRLPEAPGRLSPES